MQESEPLIREVTENGGEFVLFPKGRSMLPLLVQGRDAVVLTSIDGELKKGQIPLYKRDDGQYVLHRIIRKEKDGTYTMSGDNHLVLEKGLREDQMIAVVCAVIRKKKRKSVKALSYRLYSFLWRSFFLRRVYFKLRWMANGKYRRGEI